MVRVPFGEICVQLHRVLVKMGFAASRAELCARLFAEASRDGVHSHGVHRFPRFARTIQNGTVNPRAQAAPRSKPSLSCLEQWDGYSGPGNLNAHASMARAIELSRMHGMGCVALANTNHWMRGGSYGWQAADAGVIGICWTNTLPNLPPWGATKPALGNNPMVIAVPRARGHLVLDMAMSQFSFGSLDSYRRRGEPLPVPGGFDLQGELTRDPAAIEASMRPLPIGYWKGSGLALMLDVIGAVLSSGNLTAEIPSDVERETGLSQVFLAISLEAVGGLEGATRVADVAIAALHSAKADGSVRYPGERVLKIRKESLERGVEMDPLVWEQVLAM